MCESGSPKWGGTDGEAVRVGLSGSDRNPTRSTLRREPHSGCLRHPVPPHEGEGGGFPTSAASRFGGGAADAPRFRRRGCSCRGRGPGRRTAGPPFRRPGVEPAAEFVGVAEMFLRVLHQGLDLLRVFRLGAGDGESVVEAVDDRLRLGDLMGGLAIRAAGRTLASRPSRRVFTPSASLASRATVRRTVWRSWRRRRWDPCPARRRRRRPPPPRASPRSFGPRPRPDACRSRSAAPEPAGAARHARRRRRSPPSRRCRDRRRRARSGPGSRVQHGGH